MKSQKKKMMSEVLENPVSTPPVPPLLLRLLLLQNFRFKIQTSLLGSHFRFQPLPTRPPPESTILNLFSAVHSHGASVRMRATSPH